MDTIQKKIHIYGLGEDYGLVYEDFIISPRVLEDLIKNKIINKSIKKLQKDYFNFKETDSKKIKIKDLYFNFIRDCASEFLKLYNYKHNKSEWYIDIIRYNLDNETKGVDSGLVWHTENCNYPNVVTVLMYLDVDETIKNGNLEYKNKNNDIKVINIKSGTTIIMDGDVYHKPQDPYGSGKRNLIIISFTKE